MPWAASSPSRPIQFISSLWPGTAPFCHPGWGSWWPLFYMTFVVPKTRRSLSVPSQPATLLPVCILALGELLFVLFGGLFKYHLLFPECFCILRDSMWLSDWFSNAERQASLPWHPGNAPTCTTGYFVLPLLELGPVERRKALRGEWRRFLEMQIISSQEDKQERCCTCSSKSMLKCCLHIPESSSPRRETGQDEQLNRKWITSYIIFFNELAFVSF